ncbi:hypothetical protein PIB30_057920, partial [Stylosanthes scabra]|nr:hypothetical protein [Stylosanthes scabra]
KANYQYKAEHPKEPRSLRLEHNHHHQIQKNQAEDAGMESAVHPQGSKKSKRKGNGKTQISEDLSKKKSSIVKKLSLIKDFKNVRENKLFDREKEREEEREHREKLMAIKENEL